MYRQNNSRNNNSVKSASGTYSYIKMKETGQNAVNLYSVKGSNVFQTYQNDMPTPIKMISNPYQNDMFGVSE